MQQGIFYTRLLHEGIRLAIFDHLTTKTSPDHLARTLKTHPQNTGYFLKGLAAAGLVEQQDDCYWNSSLSREFLVTDSPSYMGDYLSYHAQWNLPFFGQMEDILQNGPPRQQARADDEAIWAGGARAMVNFQRTCTGPVLARIICERPEFPSFRHMLDLGSGPGFNTLAVLRSHPSMTGVLFDRPAVIQVARQEILHTGMEDRFDFLGGDFSVDDIGSGYDLILATACLNFVQEDMTAFVKKIYRALNPGGLFISVHDGLTHGRTRPRSIALSWLPVSMMWQDLGLDRGVIAGAMAAAGFKEISSEPVAFGLGTMDLDIAQKP